MLGGGKGGSLEVLPLDVMPPEAAPVALAPFCVVAVPFAVVPLAVAGGVSGVIVASPPVIEFGVLEATSLCARRVGALRGVVRAASRM